MDTQEGVDNVDVYRFQQDINELKSNQTQIKNEQLNMKSDIVSLQMNDKLQDQEINTLKVTLNEIKEDTNFIRRKITGALITAIITAVVGGLIAIAVATIYG